MITTKPLLFLQDSTINDFRNFIEDLYRGRLEDRERFRKICQKYHLTQSRHATNTGVHTSIHGNQLITEMKDVARKYEREESCLHKMIASEIRWIIDMVKIPVSIYISRIFVDLHNLALYFMAIPEYILH